MVTVYSPTAQAWPMGDRYERFLEAFRPGPSRAGLGGWPANELRPESPPTPAEHVGALTWALAALFVALIMWGGGTP